MTSGRSPDSRLIRELCGADCVFPASGLPQYPGNDYRANLDLSEGVRPRWLWAIGGVHPDLRANNAHGCPVSHLLRVRRPAVPGISEVCGILSEYEQRFQLYGSNQERRTSISASGGQGRGVVWVTTLQTGGGAHRWLTRWRTLLTATTLLSQRAEPSLLGSGTFPKPRIRRGTTRIPRVGCDTRGGAAPGVSPRRTVRRAWRRKWRERPRVFRRWCTTGQGEVVHAKVHHLPSPSGSLPPQ